MEVADIKKIVHLCVKHGLDPYYKNVCVDILYKWESYLEIIDLEELGDDPKDWCIEERIYGGSVYNLNLDELDTEDFQLARTVYIGLEKVVKPRKPK